MNSSAEEAKNKRKSRLVIVAVFAVFMGPIVLAILMQSNLWSYQPESSKAHGKLLKPVVAVPALQQIIQEREKWWLLVLDDGDCASDCESTLVEIRQLRKTTGRHMGKVALLYIGQSQPDHEASAKITKIAPGITVIADSEVYKTILATSSTTDGSGEIWLLDRELMLFMHYDSKHNGTGIRKDLKKLLTWAQEKPE